MANIKTTDAQWANAREYFEAGLPLSKIVVKTGISKTQLSKRSNQEEWAKGTDKKHLIAAAIDVKVAKGTLTEQALKVHNEIVDEKTQDIILCNSAQRSFVKLSMAVVGKTLVNGRPTEETMEALVKMSPIVSTSRMGLVGKPPDTAIQINNTQQVEKISYEIID